MCARGWYLFGGLLLLVISAVVLLVRTPDDSSNTEELRARNCLQPLVRKPPACSHSHVISEGK